MRTCACGNYIPYRIKIGEKSHNLKNRKKCLKCLPFGQFPHPKREITQLKADRATQARNRYWRFKESNGVDYTRILREGRKSNCVAHLGGKCFICGYFKYNGSLSFHHVNIKDKSFSISERGFQLSFSRVLAEMKKCILICHNCHGEIHGGVVPTNKINSAFVKMREKLQNFPRSLWIIPHVI